VNLIDLDTVLVEEARRGSAQAFDRLVAKHQQAVRSFLRRVTGDWADADDLAQDAFVAAWSGLDSYKGASSVRSWLCAIAWRKALGTIKSHVTRGRAKLLEVLGDGDDQS